MILGVHRFLLTFFIISFCFSLHCEPIEAGLAEIQILDKITAKVKTYEILNNKNLRVGSLNIEVLLALQVLLKKFLKIMFL